MNLVEDFDNMYRNTGYQMAGASFVEDLPSLDSATGIADDMVIVEQSSFTEMPLLSVETTIRQAAR